MLELSIMCCCRIEIFKITLASIVLELSINLFSFVFNAVEKLVTYGSSPLSIHLLFLSIHVYVYLTPDSNIYTICIYSNIYTGSSNKIFNITNILFTVMYKQQLIFNRGA